MTEADLQNDIEILRKRKCAYCNQILKKYVFGSSVIPLNYIVEDAMKFSEEISLPYPVFFFLAMPSQTYSRVMLAATCECGNISFWNFKRETVIALLSPQMQKDGYELANLYSEAALNFQSERTTNEEYRQRVKELLEIFQWNKDGASEHSQL